MSADLQLAQFLPFMRRFARALTASQSVGDRLVASALESLLADPRLISELRSPRIALYRTLVDVWWFDQFRTNQPAAPAGAVAPDRPAAIADKRLQDVAPLARAGFLLLRLEDFSVRETAAILSVDPKDVEVLVDQAGREISGMVKAKVLIIEDEPLIAMELEDMVRFMGHEPCGVARTRGEAVQLAAQAAPGLILADIQLADGSSGIDAVNDLLVSVRVPIIFITAYPERLLTGQRPEPVFLITKPFQPEAVKALITQALFFDTRASVTLPTR